MQNKDELLQALADNAIVITPNNRLSAQLLNDFATKHLSLNQAVAKPLCLPYQSFLQYLLQKLQHSTPEYKHPVLLSASQERYLWQKIINNHASLSIVPHIQEAWNRCRTWQVDINAPEFQATSQCQISQKLQIRFAEYLAKHNLISQANLVNYLLKPLPLQQQKIIFACFDDYTPSQLLLQEHLTNLGNEILHFDLQTTRADYQQYIAKDAADEKQAILTWLKEKLENNSDNLAVVMPNIAEQGQDLVRLIKKQLPDVKLNISLGESLDKFLIINHALRWISLNDKLIPQSEARLLLNSPFINGSQSEFTKRIELAQNSKLLSKRSILIEDFIQESHKSAPILSNILKNISKYPDSASPNTWSKIFAKRLQEFGFPGDYPINSTAYQCLQRLQDVFAEFKSLALLDKYMSKEQALATCSELIQQSIFQPQNTKAQVNILGLLEASGCTFSSIWVNNLTDRCLPGKTNFSAFIPIELQKKLCMPHATNSRELQFAKQQLQRLKSSCDDIIFSYPSFIDDIPMLGSPLLHNMPRASLNILENQANNTSKLVTYSESYKLPVNDPSTIKGGTSLLANQAKCPFKAFAKHRLYALTREDIFDWPNNLERGQMLHKILENFWEKTNSQSQLKILNSAEISVIVKEIIHDIVSSDQQNQLVDLDTVIANGEIERLTKLVTNALTWELSRPDFKINAIEKNYKIKLGELDFNIRIDRIDTLLGTDGEQVVIDYKSNMPSSKPWKDERPLEPQLLIYALLEPSIRCIMYLELKNSQVTANGISASDLHIDGIKPIKANEDWESMKMLWQEQLNTLAYEFCAGDCPPQPSKASICQTCDLQDLCKVI